MFHCGELSQAWREGGGGGCSQRDKADCTTAYHDLPDVRRTTQDKIWLWKEIPDTRQWEKIQKAFDG